MLIQILLKPVPRNFNITKRAVFCRVTWLAYFASVIVFTYVSNYLVNLFTYRYDESYTKHSLNKQTYYINITFVEEKN